MSAHFMPTADLSKIQLNMRPAASREVSASTIQSTSSTSSTRSACDRGTCPCDVCEQLIQQCKLGNLNEGLLPSQFCTRCTGLNTSIAVSKPVKSTKSNKSSKSSVKSSDTISSTQSKFADLSFKQRMNVIMNLSVRGY